jgi:hypothetical protein
MVYYKVFVFSVSFVTWGYLSFIQSVIMLHVFFGFVTCNKIAPVESVWPT